MTSLYQKSLFRKNDDFRFIEDDIRTKKTQRARMESKCKQTKTRQIGEEKSV